VSALPHDLIRQLERRVADAQRQWHAPSVVARVVRRGTAPSAGPSAGAEVLLDLAAGSADLGPDGTSDPPPLAAGPDVQYRMGSITKTFSAVLMMQARDAGLLDLDDPLTAHLDVPAHGSLTLRRMLCHLSGLQREPVGEVWESLQGPALAELLAGLGTAEAVLRPHERWHYSNLAYALLGQVAATVRGTSWAELLQRDVLDPLGLARTTTAPAAPVARGYFVDPYADRLLPEPLFPGHAFAPAAELWTTAADLARWASFWADPDPAVLAPATVTEMTHLHAMADQRRWTLGWGLGLMLHRSGERVLVGHDGAMPGFLASMVVDRGTGVGAVVLVNTSRAADPGTLALELVTAVLDDVPAVEQPWRPGPPVPDDVEALLGPWWSEGVQHLLAWRGGTDPGVDGDERGHLEATTSAQGTAPPTVLRRDGTDRWRVVRGREQGELLRVVRDAEGRPTRLYWATYPMTRLPLPFGR
jgi:CubicO group peptidase (beta-lactamase class C family)